MNWGNAIITKLHYAGAIVTRLEGTLHLAGDPKKTEKKLTWLDGHASQAADFVPVNFIELDTLVTVPKVEEGVDFESIVNPKTIHDTLGMGEPALRNVQKGVIIQIARRGFFIVDALATAEGTPMQMILIPDGRMKAMSTLSTKVDKAKGFQGK
jgi:glutamyl-tRNA synthetase